MTQNQDKKKIIRDLEVMKGYELSAKDFYTRVYSDPNVEEQQVKEAFKSIAEDEQRHAEAVQEIIDLVNNAL
jgi:rubrerythrin